MNREEILNEAIKQVTGHRKEDYGKIEDNFKTIADFWSVYLKDKLTSNISPKDVAMMMSLLKIARIKRDTKSDSYVDLAGYASCAGEIADSCNDCNRSKWERDWERDAELVRRGELPPIDVETGGSHFQMEEDHIRRKRTKRKIEMVNRGQIPPFDDSGIHTEG